MLGAMRGRRNGSIIAFLGDHGFKTGLYGGWGKHTLMRDDTRVPLLLQAPDVPISSHA